MYSREEAKKLKEEFWTTFGQYMRSVPSAEAERINWVNYKTGIRHLFFRMDADKKKAIIMIELTNQDEGIRKLMFAQFEEFQGILSNTVGEEWEWTLMQHDEYGKTSSTISCTLENVNIFNKEHWPQLISFFKPRIIALDEFWSAAKYSFDIFK